MTAARSTGLASVEDFNGRMDGCAGPYSVNVVDERRMNTGIVYLTDEVRRRPNLTIRSGAQADRLVIANGRVTGVRLVDGEIVTGGEIILSGATYGSPTILMRFGLGPAAHLRGLDIPVVADLPVGTRLQAPSSGPARHRQPRGTSTSRSWRRTSTIRGKARPAARSSSPAR